MSRWFPMLCLFALLSAGCTGGISGSDAGPPSFFTAVYEIDEGGTIEVSLGPPRSVSGPDMITRQAYPLRLVIDSDFLLGSGVAAFPRPFTVIYDLADDFRVVRLVTECMVPHGCGTSHVTWEPYGSLPPAGFLWPGIEDDGQLHFHIWNESLVAPFEVVKGAYPPFDDEHFSPEFLASPVGPIKYAVDAPNLPAEVEVSAHQFMRASEQANITLRLRDHTLGETAAGADSWPMIPAPISISEKGPLPGVDKRLFGRDFTIREALQAAKEEGRLTSQNLEDSCWLTIRYEAPLKAPVGPAGVLPSSDNWTRVHFETTHDRGGLWAVEKQHAAPGMLDPYTVEPTDRSFGAKNACETNWQPYAHALDFEEFIERADSLDLTKYGGWHHFAYFLFEDSLGSYAESIGTEGFMLLFWAPDFGQVGFGHPLNVQLDPYRGLWRSMVIKHSDLERLDQA